MKSRFDRSTALAVILAVPCLLLSAAILLAAFRQSLGRSASPEASESHRPVSPVAADTAAIPPAESSPREIRPRAAEPELPSVNEPVVPTSPPPSPPPQPTEVAQQPAATPSAGSASHPANPASPPSRVLASNTAQLYGREAYSTLQELRALIESQAWDEAARQVTSASFTRATGVSPWISDPSLLVSQPVAVQLAHAQYPQLRQSLGGQYETLAKLRVADAIRRGDERAVEMAAIQFAGAQAIAEAHQWLADQALLQGQVLQAGEHYHAALQADNSLATELAPRQQLAAAMAGNSPASIAPGDVRFGAVSESAASFASLLAELRSRSSSSNEVDNQRSLVHPPEVVPPSIRFQECAQLEEFLAPTGRSGDRRPPLAVTMVGTVGYLASPHQLAAYDFQNQRLLWRSPAVSSSRIRGRSDTFRPVRPVVLGDRVVACLLREQGPQLSCFDSRAGSLQWTSPPRAGQSLLAGPVIHDGQLLALAVHDNRDGKRAIQRCRFDWATGAEIAIRELLSFDDKSGSREGLAVVHNLHTLAVVGHLTIGIDPAGELQWVRTAAPQDAAGDSTAMASWNDAVIISRPYEHALESVEAATGRLRWKQPLGAPGRLAGVGGNVAVVECEDSLVGVSADQGQQIWRYPATSPAVLAVGDSLILAAAASAAGPLQLTWLSGNDGSPLGTTRLPDDHAHDRIEQLIFSEKQQFALVRRGAEADLRIVKLEPANAAARSRFLQRPITMEFPLSLPTLYATAPCLPARSSWD